MSPSVTPSSASQVMRSLRVVILRLVSAALVVGLGVSPAPARAATSPWTKVATIPPITTNLNSLQLLTDGSVLAGDGHQNWYRLTPDTNGKYETGTWSQVASSHVARTFFPSTILKDGRYMIGGGEYFGGTDNATVDIYDPVSDTWTSGPDMPAPIGDTAASILPNGTFLVSSVWEQSVYLYDPVANIWSTSQVPIGTGHSGDEKGWTLLQNGTVLDAFDVWSVYTPANSSFPVAQWDTWSPSTPFPPGITLEDSANGEIGPMSLLQSGAVIQFGGANGTVGQTAIYDPTKPPATAWRAGPSAPDNRQFDDSPAAVMPSGSVLCATSSAPSGNGCDLDYFEYSPILNAFTPVPTPPFGQFNSLFLVLPTGQVLVEPLFGPILNFYVYTSPTGTTAGSSLWQPTITGISGPTAGEFTINGKQLNGLTTGASYGDDHNMATNFPIVALVNTSGTQKYYARTYKFDQMAPLMGWQGSANFTLPPVIPNGVYNVHVFANGVDSTNTPSNNPMSLTVSGTHVTQMTGAATAAPGTAVTWIVSISGASPLVGTTVNLHSSNTGVATVPASVFLHAGASSFAFSVSSLQFGNAMITAQTATANSQFQAASKEFGWTVSSVTPVVNGAATVEIVTLSSAAPTGGIVVNLSANLPGVSLPQTVTVPAGTNKSPAFFVSTTTNPGLAVIHASLFNSSQSGYLTDLFFNSNVWDYRWAWLQLVWN